MHCFNHAEVEAVGICKNCGRGLCHTCASERPTGIACRTRCETEVDAIGNLVQRNVRLSAGASSMSLLAVLVYFGSGAVFLYLWYQEENPTMRMMFVVLAAIMIVCGLANARVILSRRASQKA